MLLLNSIALPLTTVLENASIHILMLISALPLKAMGIVAMITQLLIVKKVKKMEYNAVLDHYTQMLLDLHCVLIVKNHAKVKVGSYTHCSIKTRKSPSTIQ
jgi:hypothetical protein